MTFLTYDLAQTTPDPHGPIIDALLPRGWYRWSIGDFVDHKSKLPNTTLEGEFVDLDTAQRSFDAAILAVRAQGITLNVRKWLIVEYVRCRFYSDELLPLD